jgi:hypothetical protein
MTSSEINRAVANVLGEALDVVRQRDFDLVEHHHVVDAEFDTHNPSTIDWDATDSRDRVASIYEVAT